MRKFYNLLFLALASLSAHAQDVATFEDLNAAPDTYWDGSDQSAMFTSGGFTFINNYTDWGGYGSWDGFAWSSMTASTYAALSDQYNACTGGGVDGSATFGVAYYNTYAGTEPMVIANDAMPFVAKGCYVTNSAYAYTSMSEGDAYAKKFDETDWFLLTATGYLEGEPTADASIYLAQQGQIVDQWLYFDLSALGTVDEIHFTLTSSDTGMWGMNTPAYFCIDDFGAEANTVTLRQLAASCSHASQYNLLGQPQSTAKGIMVRNGKVIFDK